MLMDRWADAPRVKHPEVAVRTTVAAIAGALLATLGLAAWQTRSAEVAAPAAAMTQWPGAPGVQTVGLSTDGLAAAGAAAAVPTVVRCAPGQQAVLQQRLVAGRVETSAECAWDTSAPAGDAAAARPLPATDIVEYQPRAQTVRYVQAEPVRRRVVREAPKKRSWQKSALVIGGSAGAGAGIGALAGGKKGALIGAAIGGGSGAIFEAIKRR